MTYTRKQVVTCLSVVVSPTPQKTRPVDITDNPVVLVPHNRDWSWRVPDPNSSQLQHAVNPRRYAASRSNNRSVPISDFLTGFTTVLPIIAGLLLECGYDFTRSQERRRHLSRGQIQRPPLVIVANTIIFIYSTVVITLLGTHAAPSSGLDCGLRKRWETLFKTKDSTAIKKIQDAFSCCGLANPRDMAWPFPDRSHDARACENAFGRSNGCLSAWKAEEQQIAGLLIGVVGMVFIWQVCKGHYLRVAETDMFPSLPSSPFPRKENRGCTRSHPSAFLA
jgi:hypothetical protein